MKQFVKDFKEFTLKGNILDMAVGVVVGGAFNKVVGSLVENIIMPLISTIFQAGEISTWVAMIGNTAVPYGLFIQSMIDFLLIALSVFVALRFIVKFKRNDDKTESEAIVKSDEVVLLEEIRDLLKNK